MDRIDRSRLPYPGLNFVQTRHGSFFLEDAVTAGTAQYPKGYRQRGGRIADSEGYLVFSEDAVVFYAGSGAALGWYYSQITSHSVKRGWALSKLTIRSQGFEEVFKVGEQLAANADYILQCMEVGVPG